MRRFRALLIAAGLAAMPASAAAGLSNDSWSSRGRAICGAADVLTALAHVAKGQPVAVEIVRDKQPLSLQATLANAAASRMPDPWSTLPPWMRDTMRPLVAPDDTAAPFGPRWFHELLHPSTPTEPSLHS